MNSFTWNFFKNVWAGVFALLWQLAAIDSPGAVSLPNGFSQTMIANGLSSPTAMEFAPDGRLFVCQQGGELRVVKNMALLGTPFISLTTTSVGERGLLGIAFDPGFQTNQFLYLYYTATSPATHNRVSRFTANGDVAVPGSEVPILDLENLGASNHNGGAIHFGIDGKLYIALGENAVAANAQTLANRLGKILRINRDGSIPTDNPFYNTAAGVNRSIWALGLRNPYTFAVQPGTGRIFINDVGNQTWEEINEGVAGANYGWSLCEGRCSPANGNYHDPIFQYGHGPNATNGCDVTGGTFYNPIAFQYPSSYRGTYFFADACGGWIRRLNPNTGSVSNFATGLPAPVDVKVSAEGRLFYLGRNGGQVWVVDYTNAPPALGIARQGASTVILWPAPSSNYVLQSTSILPASSGWNTTNSVITTNGQKRLAIAPGGSSQFYRLMKP
jgi:glucose/arabinose dehydrogenase